MIKINNFNNMKYKVEKLPNEIWYQVLRYLKKKEIKQSFSRLNKRINLIIKQCYKNHIEPGEHIEISTMSIRITNLKLKIWHPNITHVNIDNKNAYTYLPTLSYIFNQIKVLQLPFENIPEEDILNNEQILISLLTEYKIEKYCGILPDYKFLRRSTLNNTTMLLTEPIIRRSLIGEFKGKISIKYLNYSGPKKYLIKIIKESFKLRVCILNFPVAKDILLTLTIICTSLRRIELVHNAGGSQRSGVINKNNINKSINTLKEWHNIFTTFEYIKCFNKNSFRLIMVKKKKN